MLQFDPYARISAEDAVQDSYFTPIKEQGYINPSPTHEEEHEEMRANISPNSDATDVSSSSLHRDGVLNPEREKVRESPLHLKHNVSIIYTVQLFSLLFLNFLSFSFD
jgi:hypothetical protein